MQAGKLRHRIKIQTLVDSQGADFGEAKLTPSVYAVGVPAAVEPLSGRELINADKVEAGVTHRVRMRWMPGIEPKMQIVIGTRTLNIMSVIDKHERRIELELLCLEEV
jgi:SPP1 family predicted phage head-tail adaptor